MNLFSKNSRQNAGGKKKIRAWSLICLFDSVAIPYFRRAVYLCMDMLKKKKRRVPAVQTCPASVASKKLFISVYQLLKRLDYIPNGLWLSGESILNRWKKINSATKMSLLASLLTGPYSLIERKILLANRKTNQNTFIECCLVILTHTRSKFEKLLYIYFDLDLLPWVFSVVFYLWKVEASGSLMAFAR